MRYYLDTEFNGFGGELISLALVRQDGASVYMAFDCSKPTDWVSEHVLPALEMAPCLCDRPESPHDGGALLLAFLEDDLDPLITATWIEDIVHICGLLSSHARSVDRLALQLTRVPVPEGLISNATPHNAWWDAKALCEYLERLSGAQIL